MGSTYTRQSSTEIVDGEVIQASDFNNEFEQLVSAFAVSTGHSHDGTTAEGGPVTKLLGTAITIGDGTSGTDIAVTFDGETSDGVLTWMEDEDHFKFSDDIVIDSTKRLYLNDEGGEYIYGDGTDLYLVSGADINIPANIGMTFGDDGEKIEGDGTDLTISGNNINLTATADVNIPSGVGVTFATTEKIESDGTDLSITVGSGGDINIPADIGVTFGDDGEKIEGDGTDLTITGNNINLTATADVVIPANVGITFGSGEKIEGDSTDLTVTSGADINLTATSDVNIPSGVGVTFGDDGEKIEGDGTNLTIATSNNVTVDAAADIILDAGGADVTLKDDGTTFGSLTNSSGELVIKSGSTPTTALTFSGANVTGAGTYTGGGTMTTGGNIVIPDGGNIGAASDTDAISIASTGVVTFSQSPVFPDGGVPLADLDIDGATDIGADLTTSDLIIVDDGAGGTNRKAALSRINTLVQTAGGFPLTALDIDGGTDIGEAIVDADLFIIDNGAGGTNRKVAASRIKTYIGSDFSNPASADGDSLGTASLEWSDLYLADGGIIYFGNDQEITLTHAADDGLVLKHVGTGDGKEPSLTFQAGDNDIAVNDVLGSIFFQAPDEGAGTDAVLVAAGIEAVSEGNFAADNNATKLSFKTAASEAASEKMSLSSAGLLTVSDDIVFKDGGTIGVSSATDAMTVSSAGIVTFKDDIVIKDGGTIGSTSAATAMTVASTGIVTFVDDILIKDGGTIGSASSTSAITVASTGIVTFVDDILIKDGGTIGSASSTSAITVASTGIVTFVDDILIKDGGTIGSASSTGAITVASTGIVTFVDDILIKDGGTIGSASSTGAITVASTGIVTFVDDILIKDGGTIGAASSTGAITIASSGIVTFVDDIVIKDAGTIGSASDTDAISISSGGVVNISATTANTSASDGALTVAGGAGIAADLSVGDDLRLISDSAVLNFGADSDVTLTHAADASLTLAGSTAAQLIMSTGSILPNTNTDTSNSGSVTLDFKTHQNHVLTFTGNVTLANPTTETAGQSGIITCIQDGTGSRTLSLGTDYETAEGAGITLSTAANAVDVIPYFVKASGSIQLGAVQKAFS